MLAYADVSEAWGESLANWAVYISNSPYSSPQQAGGAGAGGRHSRQEEQEEEVVVVVEEEEEAGADAPHAHADVTHGKHALKV